MNGSTDCEWLLRTLFGGGSLLLGAAWTMRRLPPARRQRLGEMATAAAMLLALLSLVPAWLLIPLPNPSKATHLPVQVEITPPLAGAEPLAMDPPWIEALEPPLTEPIAYVPVSVAEQPTARETPSRESDTPGLFAIIRNLYLTTAILLLGRWLLGHLALFRLLHRLEPVPPCIVQLFASMRERCPHARLLLSRNVSVPFSCGLFRPTVVLPAALIDRASTRTLRWIFAHELTHLRRWDAWSRLLFALGQALYFPLPWFWHVRRHVALCQEYLADASASALDCPEDYAQFLLSWTAAPVAPAGMIGVSGTKSDLFRRVSMLLQAPSIGEPHCPRRWTLRIVGGLLTLAVLVSGIGIAAPSAPRDDPKKDETKKDEPKKDDAKPAPKKETGKAETKKTEEDREIDELVDAWFKAHPPASTDPDVIQQRRDEMERNLRRMSAEQRGNVRRMLQNGKPPAFAPPPDGPPPAGGAPGGLPPGVGAPGRFGQRHEPRLGVRVEPPSAELAEQLDLPKNQGLVVREVVRDSAASKAGVKTHDVIVELNGKPVSNRIDELMRRIAGVKTDDAVEIVVLRKGKKETIKDVKLPEAKAAAPGFFPGGVPGGGPPGGFAGPGGFPPPMQPGFTPPGVLGGRGSIVTTLIRTDDQLTLRHQEGGLSYSLTGKTEDGKTKIETIQIFDAGKLNRYESVDKVPERYRAKVKSLIELAGKQPTKSESK